MHSTGSRIAKQFIQRVMVGVTIVSYRFNINGIYLDIVQAKRGIRKDDPVSPLLFIIVMEYLHRAMMKMQRNPNFNHHSK